jgi:hypothetical protein
MLLDPYVLNEIMSNENLIQFAQTCTYYNTVCHNLWTSKLQHEFNIAACEHPGRVYSQLIITSRSIPGANVAARCGRLDALKYLVEVLSIRPNQWGANEAAKRGHRDVLAYLTSLTPPILPTQD